MHARRHAIRSLLCLIATLGALPSFALADVGDNPIVQENRLPGSPGWQIGTGDHSIADDVGGEIKGYASATSVNHGETLTLHISVNEAQRYDVDVYRLGWYAGAGGRLMYHVNLAGTPQPACPVDAQTGMVECHWEASLALAIPESWTSGVYVAVLTNAQGYQNYVLFVVRDDSRRAPLLYQMSVTTFQAYNNYPRDGARGKSLYDSNSYGPDTALGTRRAVQVSFDRPYSRDGLGTPSDTFMHYELFFVRWLERSGYDVSYSTDLDTHVRGARLPEHRALLSVGHDEYWTLQMYDAVEAARDAGMHLGFFGANAVYWQIRMAPASDGTPNRTMIAYKDRNLDPVSGPTTTVRWRDSPLDRPEQRLIGVQYGSGGLLPGRDMRIINSGSWVYEGTGFTDGLTVPGIVADEVDRLSPDYPGPTALSYVTLSSSPLGDARPPAESSVYQAPSGAWVFGAGTIGWSLGLDGPLADARIQRATANVLNRFVGASATTLYVTPSGSEASMCELSAPCSASRADAIVAPGDTVEVAPGNYDAFRLARGGTSRAGVVWRSTTRWGAHVPNVSIEASAPYVTFEGFDVGDSEGNLISVDASYSRIVGNHVHDSSSGCASGGGIVISGYQDGGYSGVGGEVLGNVVEDIGVGPRDGSCRRFHGIYSSISNVRIINNVERRALGYGIHLWHAARDNTIVNNTVTDNGTSGILIGAGDDGAPGVPPMVTGNFVANNIAVSNVEWGITECCDDSQRGPNQYVSNLGWRNGDGNDASELVGNVRGGGTQSDSLHADPQFVDPSDYHLQPASPAINSGTTTDAPTTDLDGNPRPQGAGIDRGAYEAVSAPYVVVPPPTTTQPPTTTPKPPVKAKDAVRPTIKLSAPKGGTYRRGRTVRAKFVCTDNVKVVKCKGTVRSGARINTRTRGRKTFKVVATDAAGNARTVSLTYRVR